MKVRLTLMLFLISASSVLGQILKIGPNPSSTNSSAGGADVSTFVDLTVPATANGTATSATFTWSGEPCPNAAKIKFFHRTGNTLTLYDERGPFSVTVPTVTVALTPPVNVQAGDLIGITQLTNCGNATALGGTAAGPGYLIFTGDTTGSVTTGSGFQVFNSFLAVGGSGVAVSGATIPALSPWMLALLALGMAATGYLVLRR